MHSIAPDPPIPHLKEEKPETVPRQLTKVHLHQAGTEWRSCEDCGFALALDMSKPSWKAPHYGIASGIPGKSEACQGS